MTASSPPLAAARPQPHSLLANPALPWLLAALGVLSLYGSGDLVAALHGLRLPDTDDAMRLAEVRDLAAGQSWFDMVQHRFLPPAGVASHWSRLVDAPLAAAIAALTPMLGQSLAERVTTAFWPPLLFVLYACVLMRGMRTLAPSRAALFGVFVATQTLPLAMQFAPGRIDHHDVQIVLLLGVGLALMQPLRTWRTGALAGLLAAASLAVGLEALPLIAVSGLVVVAEWIIGGRRDAPTLAGFGASLGLGATALYGLQMAPALWAVPACDALSPPWLWLTGTGGAMALAALRSPETLRGRSGLAAGIGTIGIAGFAVLFPSCLHGPFPDMPEQIRTDWLDRVREMQPLWTLLHDRPTMALGFSGSLFVATLASFVLAMRDVSRRRIFVIACLFLMVGAILGTLQMRGLYVASAFVPVIAGICLDRAFTAIGQGVAGRMTRIALVATVIALDGHAWLPAGLIWERMAGTREAIAAQTKAEEVCTVPGTLAPLGGLPMGLVLAPIDLGPYLLVHTPHAIVAAPYHRATAGLAAGLVVANGDEAALHRQAQAVGARYLVLCPGEAGDAFAARLVRGTAQADWLSPIFLDDTALKVWRIH